MVRYENPLGMVSHPIDQAVKHFHHQQKGKSMKSKLLWLIAVGMFSLAVLAQNANQERQKLGGNPGDERITREVRHELVMLPYYSVFDNLAYQVNNGTVTLLGQVSRPSLKDDAGRSVKKIEGVEN